MPSPFKVVIFFILICLIGIATIPNLGIDLNPSPSTSSISIQFNLPNASPEVVEHQATGPLENILSAIQGIEAINSVSNYNSGSITLRFDNEIDMDFKKLEVSSAIRNVYDQLPESLSYPLIQANHSENKEREPLMIYRVNAPFTSGQIEQTTKNVVLRSLSQISGIDESTLNGAQGMQLTIKLEPELMNLYNISIPDVSESIGNHFEDYYPGAIEIYNSKINVLVNQDFQLSNLESLVVHPQMNNQVRLKNIAKIYFEEQQANTLFRVNGLSSIALSIYGKEGVNKLELANQIKDKLKLVESQLPDGYVLELDYDQTKFLSTELSKIYQRSALSILILIVFIFFSTRDLRYLFILISGLIINISIAALFSWAFAINIHLYTIAGITISFGIIVDNGIVMLDHIHKKKNTRIFTSLLAASTTTICALLLIFFLPETEKQNLWEFAQIIAVTLVGSLFVALFYTPASYRLLYAKSTIETKHEQYQMRVAHVLNRWYRVVILFLFRFRKSFTIIILLIFGTPVFMLPAKWEGHDWYNKTVGSDLYQESIRPVTDKALGGALKLFVHEVYEGYGFRSNEATVLYVNASLPQGHTLDQMNKVISEVEEYVANVEGIDKFITRVYSGQRASVRISFKEDYEQGSLPYTLKSRLTARAIDRSGVGWSVYGVGRGYSNRGSDGLPGFRVKMKGYNYDELENQANVLAEKLLVHKRIQKVNTNERLSYGEKFSTQYVLDIDRTKAANFEISPGQVASLLRSQVIPNSPSLTVAIENVLTPVFISTEVSESFNLYDLMNRPITQSDSQSFTLSGMATIRKEITSNAIHKEGRQYIRILGFDYYGSYKFGNEFLESSLLEMKEEMPIGYSAEKQGWNWKVDKAKKQYGMLLVLILAIYFICSILFENLKQPFLIILTIPISFVGLFLAFAWFDFPFDQGGYAAFVLLGGLVVNAAIFIINELNDQQGDDHTENVFQAVKSKANPILLTVLSTCFGLIPFLMQGENEVFWFSLAVGTIGGLLFSLFAVFVCLPVWLMRANKE